MVIRRSAPAERASVWFEDEVIARAAVGLSVQHQVKRGNGSLVCWIVAGAKQVVRVANTSNKDRVPFKLRG